MAAPSLCLSNGALVVVHPSQPPTAPTSLNATAASYAHIDLTWTDNADNESGFEIERSTTGSSGPFSLLTTVAADTETYANIGLTGNSEYCYRVRAVNSAGNSTYSNVDCETTPVQPPFVGVCEDFDSGFTIGQTGWQSRRLVRRRRRSNCHKREWCCQFRRACPVSQYLYLECPTLQLE